MLVKIMRFGKEERAGCTSLDVAETFEKEHFHVLRNIEKLACSEEFRESNFGLSSYRSAQNKSTPRSIPGGGLCGIMSAFHIFAPLLLLHLQQSVCKLLSVVRPPRDKGTMWSISKSK